MEFNLSSLNWTAIVVCIVVGQVFLSIWFIAIFGNPWAKEYGVDDKKQHTKEIPGYTYAIQALCTFLLTLGIAILHPMLGINSAIGGLNFGLFVAVFFAIATSLPGYIFLKRMKAFWMATGSQSILAIILSIILAIW